jgi:hypothetical protein
MISGILQRYGKSALDVLVFKGCNPIIRVLVGAAIDLGLQKVDEALAV